jgi:hypothetical protein
MERYLHVFLQAIKNPQKRSLLLAALFFLGIIVSAYHLFMLRHNLLVGGGMTSSGLESGVLAKLFIIVMAAFIIGIIALNTAHRLKKEIIVYKEASALKTHSATDANTESNSADTQTFITSLKNAKKDERAQIGLNSICKLVSAGQGAWYEVNSESVIQMKAAFALVTENENISFEQGEGLVGQASASGTSFYLDELPEGYSNAILSGLGSAPPKFLFIVPVKKEEQVRAVLEIAMFGPLSDSQRKQATELATVLMESL